MHAGSEWATLGRWTVDTPGLPTVIAIELHIKTDPVWQREETTISELALFVQHLGTLGYASKRWRVARWCPGNYLAAACRLGLPAPSPFTRQQCGYSHAHLIKWGWCMSATHACLDLG